MKRGNRRTAWMCAPAIVAPLVLWGTPSRLAAEVILYSGSLRTNANVTSCGTGCTLGPSNADSDYAQWAAAVYSFQVHQTTFMEAITYSYGGGTSLTGVNVPAGGFEPCSWYSFPITSRFPLALPTFFRLRSLSGQISCLGREDRAEKRDGSGGVDA